MCDLLTWRFEMEHTGYIYVNDIQYTYTHNYTHIHTIILMYTHAHNYTHIHTIIHSYTQ